MSKKDRKQLLLDNAKNYINANLLEMSTPGSLLSKQDGRNKKKSGPKVFNDYWVPKNSFAHSIMCCK